jgi:poly(ADP-ribose) glycohydrolase ARH3
MPTPREKIRGCLLGALLGDVAGAPVEAESPQYIARTFRSIDHILSTDTVPEFNAPAWQVGRYTDDTQMTLCVAEWLLADEVATPQRLLARFAAACEPWRHYGPNTESILRLYHQYPREWRSLATSTFPHGSYGNGSAMRVAPVALAFHDNPTKLTQVAATSSRVTHSHPLALQGATLQALAVSIALRQQTFSAAEYLTTLRAALVPFADLMQDISKFSTALDTIEQALARNAPCAEIAPILGTGVDVFEAVPTALYSFLRHPHSIPHAHHHAIVIGGDTDTIASMTAALSGAFLGETAIPANWLAAVREDTYTPNVILTLADRLYDKFSP